MTSQQFKTLLTPPNIGKSSQDAAILFNTRFQTFDDLDELESLVLDAQQRNDSLQSKLASSQSKIDKLLRETRLQADANLHSARELSLLRHSLTDELYELSQELTSTMSDAGGNSTLLEDIETLHRNLKELQSVKGYVQVIEHGLKLSESCLEQIRGSNKPVSTVTLSEYQALQAFVSKVSEACSRVENGGSEQQTLKLVEFLEKIRDKAWRDIQDILSSSLQTAAEKVGWPMPVDYHSASVEDRSVFENSFRNLLKLQKIGEKIRIPTPIPQLVKDGLYPLQALVQPIALRFKYHFDGNRQTNRLDKPEWYFTHILNVAHEHRSFMDSVIQRLLASSEYSEINAWREFTLLLLSILSKKLKQGIPSLLPHPPLLAHTIYQALSFDAALAEDGFLLQNTSATNKDDKWEGVSDAILGNTEWFEAWVLGEQRFAEDQYHDAVGAPDAWLIASDEANDESSHSDLKSTNSARKICALVEQVTDRYSPLPRFHQRARFLLSVQLPLLDYYHTRIVSSLDAFETFSSAFVRAVPGALTVSLGGGEEGGVNVNTRGLTSGVEGVQRLCKALVSAKYVENTMRGWAEELFFVELWAEISQNPTLRGYAISNPLLPDPKDTEADAPSDTLFEALIARYKNLVDRAKSMIIQQVCGEIESVLKAHFSTTTSPDFDPNQVDDIALSQTLLVPVALISSHLSFLRVTLPQAMLTTLYRRIVSRLAEHILQRQIIYRGRFDLREGKGIRAECQLWVETCQAALGGGLGGGRARIEAPWTKLLQAGSLASIEGDVLANIVDVTFGPQSDDEWDRTVTQIVGSLELSRDEVVRTLRRRQDCNR